MVVESYLFKVLEITMAKKTKVSLGRGFALFLFVLLLFCLNSIN